MLVRNPIGVRAIFNWTAEKPVKTVKRYIDAVNSRDRHAVATLLHEQFRFVDSQGGWFEGRDCANRAFARFFDAEPNFRITPNRIVAHEGDVLIMGEVTADDERLRNNKLWRARAHDGRLERWQSFGEGEVAPLAQILAPEDAHGVLESYAE